MSKANEVKEVKEVKTVKSELKEMKVLVGHIGDQSNDTLLTILAKGKVFETKLREKEKKIESQRLEITDEVTKPVVDELMKRGDAGTFSKNKPMVYSQMGMDFEFTLTESGEIEIVDPTLLCKKAIDIGHDNLVNMKPWTKLVKQEYKKGTLHEDLKPYVAKVTKSKFSTKSPKKTKSSSTKTK